MSNWVAWEVNLFDGDLKDMDCGKQVGECGKCEVCVKLPDMVHDRVEANSLG